MIAQAQKTDLTPEAIAVVTRIASAIYRKCKRHCEYDDLLQEGLLAAALILPDYDPRQGFLATFLSRRVRGAMIDHLRNTNWFGSAAARGLGSRSGMKMHQMVMKKDREYDMKHFYLKEMGGMLEPAAPYREPSSHPEEEFQAKLKELCPGLTRREKTALTMYFCREMEQTDVAREMGVSASRVSQVIKNAISQIRAKLGISLTRMKYAHSMMRVPVREPQESMTSQCFKCGRWIEPRVHGKPKLYCSKLCGQSVHGKCHRKIEDAMQNPPAPHEFRPEKGATVILHAPDETFIHGHIATVTILEEWGAHVLVHRPGATFDTPGHQPKWRALWSEMRPNGKPKPTEPDERAVARAKGYTGDVCVKCQGCRLVRNGSCLRCEDCGETTGCG